MWTLLWMACGGMNDVSVSLDGCEAGTEDGASQGADDREDCLGFDDSPDYALGQLFGPSLIHDEMYRDGYEACYSRAYSDAYHDATDDCGTDSG